MRDIHGNIGSASTSQGTTPWQTAKNRGHASIQIRSRVTAVGRRHYLFRDKLLRSKCPKERQQALELAIQFREEHDPTEPIPTDLLDELLQKGEGEKYYCFCCPDRRGSTITPARDHVRKALGNFPFKCSNSWWYVIRLARFFITELFTLS